MYIFFFILIADTSLPWDKQKQLFVINRNTLTIFWSRQTLG